jgi:homoserine acetyltransferase
MNEAFLPEARFSLARPEGELVYYRYGSPNLQDEKCVLAIHGITAHHLAW